MKMTHRILALAIAMVMVFALTLTASADEAKVYVLNAEDLTAFAQGEKADYDTLKAGTDEYFTIHFSAKTKVDSSNKTFNKGADGELKITQRINFGGKTKFEDEGIKNCIKITTSAAATVKIWWVQGGEGTDEKPLRDVAIYDTEGNILSQIGKADSIKNEAIVSTLEISAAGTYYIGSTPDHNPIYRIEVTEAAPAPIETTAPSETTVPSETTTATAAPTVKPGDENQKTGDPITMMVAMMAVSAIGIAVVGKKKS